MMSLKDVLLKPLSSYHILFSPV